MSVLPGSARKAFRILYWSFSNAGWFCRLGRRELNRPVSVFRFRLPWMRECGSTRDCSGSRKVERHVPIMLRVMRESSARHARCPCWPHPKALYARPHFGGSSRGCPARSRRAAISTAGAPFLVKEVGVRPREVMVTSRVLILATHFSTSSCSRLSSRYQPPPSVSLSWSRSRTSAFLPLCFSPRRLHSAFSWTPVMSSYGSVDS
mmetsp:Transcript_137991/g.239902  ORF Transcript_137991/g.239902 Transcript_137991/m.239902 type:complete len:205 (-) Transcript_137991:325-939(-)